jgi:hypothetical protein
MNKTKKMSNAASVFDMRFPLARSMIVSGPSCSGKTFFVSQLLKNVDVYFNPQPKRVFWFYGEIEPSPKPACRVKIECKRGLPTDEDIENFHLDIVVLDDLMWESRSSIQVGNLFTRVAHHRQCFIIHITQNLFQSGSVTRTQSLNAHYFVLFKNPRDRSQIIHLARQIYPRQQEFFLSCFEDATQQEHGYLLVDLSPNTIEDLRLRANILLVDKQYFVYFSDDKNVYQTSKRFSSHPTTLSSS